MVYGPLAAFWSELFDTRYRYTALWSLYQLSGIVASGLTPLIAAWLVTRGDGTLWWVAGYNVAVPRSRWPAPGSCPRRAVWPSDAPSDAVRPSEHVLAWAADWLTRRHAGRASAECPSSRLVAAGRRSSGQ